MRVALVTAHWEEGGRDPENAFLQSLARGLAERGCDMEIFTTTSSAPAAAGPGELVWNRYHPRGTGEEAGLVVHRFPAARTGSPLHGMRRRPPVEWWEHAARGKGIAEYCLRALGEGRGMLCGGWHRYELWDDGPARWSREEGTLILCGRSIEEMELRLQAPLEQVVRIEVEDGEKEVPFSAGEEKRVSIRTSPRDSLLVCVRPGRMFRPAADRRKLGIALREVRFRDACALWDVEMARGPEDLPDGDWERIPAGLAEELSALAGWAERHWKRGTGPFAASLGRSLAGHAGDFQAVIAARARYYTAKVALDVARGMAVPLVLIPLLPPRAAADLPLFLHLAEGAQAVMDPDPAWRESMNDMGKPFFHVPAPVFFTAWEEKTSQCGEAAALRRHLRWQRDHGEARLLVSAEGSPQGERRALEILRIIQEERTSVRVVVTGRGVEGETRPLGPLPGDLEIADLSTCPTEVQRLLTGLCDIYVQTARASDWGDKICLAQAYGKETVAWEGCHAAATLHDLMGTGHLCGKTEDFARIVIHLVEVGGAGGGARGESTGAAAREKMRSLRERTLADLLAWLDGVREGFSRPQ